MGRPRLLVGAMLAVLLGALSGTAVPPLARPHTTPESPRAACRYSGARLPFRGARAAHGQWRMPSGRAQGAAMQETTKRLLLRGGAIADPKMMATWEAVQSVAPGNWQQDLLQRLNLPVPEGGSWNASEMAEELSLFQAVSEHLLGLQQQPQPGTPASFPHQHLLSLLLAHGSSRLLQASFGPCSPGITAGSQEEQQQHRDFLTRSMMQILSKLEAALQGGKGAGEVAFVVETPLLSFSMRRLISSQLGAAVLSFPSNPWAARILMPEQRALDPFVPPDVYVDVQMRSFLRSPFSPNGTSTQQRVTGTVVELELLVGGTEIQVSNLRAPVQIFLPQMSAAVDEGPTFVVSPGSSLLLTVTGRWAGGFLGIHSRTQPQQPLGLFLLQWNQQLLEPSAVDSGGCSWLVGPEVLLALEGTPRFLLVPLNLSAGDPPIFISLSAYRAQCLSWHQPSAQWREEGCTVGPQSRPVPGGHCLCTHLSSFGVSLWVAPVQLDLVRTAEYFGRVSKNPALVILLGVLYTLYLAGVVWAHWMDRRDQPKVGAALLPEDDPCALYGYRLCVKLQEPLSSGFIPGLCIILQGSSGTSKPRHLPSSGTTTFLLREPCPLGELQRVWLWQESSSIPQVPRYVLDITVHDLPQRKRFRFPCHAWLAAAEDERSPPQCFPAAPPEQAFWPVFWQRALRGLWEEHTVLLVLRPPPRSPFTRAQRLSCGWCLLLCSALISLMFWEVPQDDVPHLLHLGVVFSLSWKDVVIGVECALLAFPINLLVVLIFQRSRPRRHSRGPPTMPSAPAAPTSSQAAVLEHLRMAVEVLSRGTERPEPRQPPLPSLGLDELLQLLGHFILADGGQPRTLCGVVESGAASSLHQDYCRRYLLLKLQHVARLLEELEARPFPGRIPPALQQVQEMVAALAHVPPLPGQFKWGQWHLPWWGVLVGWALLVSLSALATFFILLYGFHYGKESTERWLVSTALSLGQSLLVLQPLKVVCFAIFFALVLKETEDDDPAEEGSLDLAGGRLGSLL